MQFIDDPIAYFGSDGAAMHALSAAEAEPLQQEALRYRLAQMLPAIVPLRAMADAQGLSADIALEEAPRLLFPHSIFKSYDHGWLDNLEFGRMTRWLQAFTTTDLAADAMPDFATIDAWLAWLEDERGLDVAHSTGTTGRLSLIPRAMHDVVARHQRNRVLFVDLMKRHGIADDDMWYHIIWPGAAGGHSAQQKMADGARIQSARSPKDFICLFDHDLGADYELYVVRARLARERGRLDLPPPSAHVETKLAIAEERQANFLAYQDRMLDAIADRVTGKRAMMMGSPHGLAGIAAAGTARGLDGIFAPNSCFITVGGLKGLVEPPDFAANMARFLGSQLAIEAYGASEMNTGYMVCPSGRFHLLPWVVAWLLDPTDGWRPRPREGVQEGRGAFLDLGFRSAWGGLVTADHLTIDYRPCTCGRRTPSIGKGIRRVQDRDGDFSWIPASDDAIRSALSALDTI